MKEFITQLGSTNPAPGGGAAAGISLSMAAACGEKAVRFSKDNLSENDFEQTLNLFCEIRDLGLKFHEEDQKAFMGWHNARKMPKTTKEEKEKRKAKINQYIRECIDAPFNIYKESIRLIEALEKFLPNCDKWLISDVGVANSLCGAALESSYYNILINLPFLKDEKYLQSISDYISTTHTIFFKRKDELSQKCIGLLQN